MKTSNLRGVSAAMGSSHSVLVGLFDKSMTYRNILHVRKNPAHPVPGLAVIVARPDVKS